MANVFFTSLKPKKGSRAIHMRIAAGSRQRQFLASASHKDFSRKKSHAIVVTMVKCGRMMMVVKEMVMGRNTFFEAKLAEKGSRLLRHHQERRGRYEESLSFQMEWAGRE